MSTSSQKIGLATATIIGMNAMIGAGIFGIPAALASNVGPAGILTCGLVIIAVWFMGNSIARLAYLFPQEGSFYTYTKQWGGHTMGLIATGSYLVGLMIAMGLLAQIAGAYLHQPLPFLSAYTWGIVTIIVLSILNMVGVVLSQAGQRVLICTTVFPLIATTLLCLSKAKFAYLTPFMPYGFKNVLAASRVVIFSFFGFECAASLFSVVQNPEKNVSKALTYAIMIVGGIYLLFVTSLILAIPLEHFTDPKIPVSNILALIFPDNSWIIGLVHISILSAILGTIHSMIWSSSALLVSYAKEFKNNALKSLVSSGTLNQTTSVATIGIAIFSTFLLFKNLDLFFNLTAIFIVFGYALSIVTLLTIKKEWESGENIKAVIGLGTAAIIFGFAVEGLFLAL